MKYDKILLSEKTYRVQSDEMCTTKEENDLKNERTESMERRKNVGVLMGNALTMYGRELVEGMKQAAHDRDVNLLFYLGFQGDAYRMGNVEKLTEKQQNGDYQASAVYDYVPFGDVDALVIAYGFLSMRFEEHDKEKFLSRFRKIPCILLNDSSETEGFCNIKVKNYEGMYECVEHLIKTHGCRKILYLSGPRSNAEAREREQAYRDAMLENGLAVDEDMIEYGNYTVNVEREVYELIARNPGFEAIVCANDDMAKMVYQICKAEGYVIGKDVAVTGFDDFSAARSMDPPMTTVSQNGFGVGYESIEAAICQMSGIDPKRKTVSPSLCIRQSCGCRQREVYQCMVSNKEEAAAYIDEVSWLIADYARVARTFSEITVGVQRQISRLLFYVSDILITKHQGNYSPDLLQELLRELLQNDFVSNAAVTNRLCYSIRQFLPLLEEERDRELLLEIISEIYSFVHTYDNVRLKNQLDMVVERNSYIPFFVMEPLDNLGEDEVIFWDVSAKLRENRVKSSYIFLFEHPAAHNRKQCADYQVPGKMYLASYQNEDEVISYEKNQRPVIQEGMGIRRLWEENEEHLMVFFGLYSGSSQYGMLAVETDLNNLDFLHTVSLQLGSLLRFCELSEKTEDKHLLRYTSV